MSIISVYVSLSWVSGIFLWADSKVKCRTWDTAMQHSHLTVISSMVCSLLVGFHSTFSEDSEEHSSEIEESKRPFHTRMM